jgi:hypothetical protein
MKIVNLKYRIKVDFIIIKTYYQFIYNKPYDKYNTRVY